MKKIFTVVLSILLIVGLFGCKESPVNNEPEVVELTEEKALEYVQGLPTDVFMAGMENFRRLVYIVKYDMEIIRKFCDLKEFETTAGEKVGVSVKTLQEKIDEIFGKNRFDVGELLAEYITDGYIMGGLYEEIQEYYDVSYEVFEVTEEYVHIKKIIARNYGYNDENDRKYWEGFLISVYATSEGLKLWEIYEDHEEYYEYVYPPIEEEYEDIDYFSPSN
jgi:hypothetical protein